MYKPYCKFIRVLKKEFVGHTLLILGNKIWEHTIKLLQWFYRVFQKSGTTILSFKWLDKLNWDLVYWYHPNTKFLYRYR